MAIPDDVLHPVQEFHHMGRALPVLLDLACVEARRHRAQFEASLASQMEMLWRL